MDASTLTVHFELCDNCSVRDAGDVWDLNDFLTFSRVHSKVFFILGIRLKKRHRKRFRLAL